MKNDSETRLAALESKVERAFSVKNISIFGAILVYGFLLTLKMVSTHHFEEIVTLRTCRQDYIGTARLLPLQT